MQYSLVITSSGRHDLLRQTWQSFQAVCDSVPRQIIVVEDGPDERPDWFPRHNLTWLCNGVRRGQIYSIDRAYSHVDNEYIFHLEDDWCFREPGFLQESRDILDGRPDILQVWLRGVPTYADIRDRGPRYSVAPHPKYPGVEEARTQLGPDWRGSFSFNPGLRRLSDWKRIGSYGRQVGYDPKGCGERAISCLYADLGYTTAILPRAHVYHIGEESHVDRGQNPAPPKILIGIPTAEVLDYSKFWVRQQETHGRVWKNGMSGIQIDGPNSRKLAVEATWWNDIAKFPNLTGRFFTGKDLGCCDDFVSLPEKNKLMCQWALDNGFDRLFRCDDDTYVYVDRLMRQAYENDVDFGGADCGGLALGGWGIWLSRRAMEVVANGQWREGEWRDDAFITDILKEHQIPMTPLTGLCDELPGRERVTLHSVNPEKMRELYLATA